jgi:hypothetical protein
MGTRDERITFAVIVSSTMTDTSRAIGAVQDAVGDTRAEVGACGERCTTVLRFTERARSCIGHRANGPTVRATIDSAVVAAERYIAIAGGEPHRE